jgi:Uncharacterized conserved protein
MKMVKQRQESITLYKQGNRADLVQQEEEEIAIIERFMPKQMDESEAAARSTRPSPRPAPNRSRTWAR